MRKNLIYLHFLNKMIMMTIYNLLHESTRIILIFKGGLHSCFIQFSLYLSENSFQRKFASYNFLYMSVVYKCMHCECLNIKICAIEWKSILIKCTRLSVPFCCVVIIFAFDVWCWRRTKKKKYHLITSNCNFFSFI